MNTTVNWQFSWILYMPRTLRNAQEWWEDGVRTLIKAFAWYNDDKKERGHSGKGKGHKHDKWVNVSSELMHKTLLQQCWNAVFVLKE